MDISEIMRTISLIVAPAVMISCCTLFLNGQLQRYDALSSRMRSMNQERFTILRLVDNKLDTAPEMLDGFDELRVAEIEAQLPHLLKRHKMIHHAVLMLGLAMLLFVISMFIIALAAMLNAKIMGVIALATFLSGMLMILAGGLQIMLEIYKSHLAVRYEVGHALSLGKRIPTLTLPHLSVKGAEKRATVRV